MAVMINRLCINIHWCNEGVAWREIMQGTMSGARRRERPHIAWMDNINTWTGLSVEESVRMTGQR